MGLGPQIGAPPSKRPRRLATRAPAAPRRRTPRAPVRTPSLPFDLVVGPGQKLVIDTSEAVLTDVHGQTLVFAGGEIFLDSLEVAAGGEITGEGPHPLRFFVRDHVKVAGRIGVDGVGGRIPFALPFNYQFLGGPGSCGGGDGGTGSPEIDTPNLIGGDGWGSGNALNLGGHGGESCLLSRAPWTGQPCYEGEDCHPAGGGGGSFATIGERGRDGTDGMYILGTCNVANGKSAIDPSHAPYGGAPARGALENADVFDDFLGMATGRLGVVSDGYQWNVLVCADAFFEPLDVGRLIAVARASGDWDVYTPPNNDPIEAPRARVLLRRIASVKSATRATLDIPLPKAPQPGDRFLVYGPGTPIAGELRETRGGSGGGAGGSCLLTLSLPTSWPIYGAPGAGGGGGGGILEIYCEGPVDLQGGELTACGGDGAGGGNSLGFDHVGGGSGGGAGGLIRVQSNTSIDCTNAKILARGGARGVGSFGAASDPSPPAPPNGIGHGGRGGRGIVQLHTPWNENGVAKIQFVPNQLYPASFDPTPVIALPEFVDDPARQRALWFQ